MAIEDSIVQTGEDLAERRRLLSEIDNWIALEPRAGHFWPTLHNDIVQLINELPGRG
jgi:hypothetical protein